MRKIQKTIASLLALILALTAFHGLFTFSVFADGEEDTTEPTESTTEPTEPGEDQAPAEDGKKDEQEEEEKLPDYTRIPYASAEEKLQNIIDNLEYGLDGTYNPEGKNVWTRYGDYYLFADSFSGEVIWQNAKTGEMLMTNPYDVANPGSSTNQGTRYDLLSQVLINYLDAGTPKYMNSYVEACQREQISVKYITNGLRVEYAMGEVESRKLVPRLIEKSRFEEMILSQVTDEVEYERLLTYYVLQDPNDPANTQDMLNDMYALYPITRQMAVYSFDENASKRELNQIEGVIKQYTKYTYDDLNEDHERTQYKGNDAPPAVFKFGLEYTLQEDGSLTVRLAANGLRYDEDNYQLQDIQLLPYFCAVNNHYQGYTFLPDGSGALIENSDEAYTLTGKVYGIDNAYQNISGGGNRQVMRLPVFGAVQYTDPVKAPVESDVEQTEGEELTEEELEKEEEELGLNESEGVEELEGEDEEDDEDGEDQDGEQTPDQPEEEDDDKNKETKPSNAFGYLAIIEEGASLASITSKHGGSVYKYSSIYTSFIPRASDMYDLSDTLSVGSAASYSVTSKRKYTGSYTLRIYMLTDEGLAKKAGLGEDGYYQTSYVGMAKAYQDYLVDTGTLTALTDEQVKDDLPLYTESLGTIDTSDTFLSLPITVKTPLTTFDDLKTMYDALAERGITNVNMRLTGFTNGGLLCTYPYKVKFEKKAGGDKGFEQLLSYAQEKGFGVFPDFDFSYVKLIENFDGFSMKKHAVRTIDSRYTSKAEYDPAWQMFSPNGDAVVSAASIPSLYEGFDKNFSKFGASSISVGTLGSDLNSDFDREDPYDRNDAQQYVQSVLGKIDDKYTSVMIDGGNVYALRYADHVLNIPLDSSRFAGASKSVPFMAMVLHGYVQYAGTPTNMASDSKYEMLKMIENGANPYFMLSYQNLSKLKELPYRYSRYYSVNFGIWLDDLTDIYNQLNDNLSSLQRATIVDHVFLDAEREHTEEETGDFSAASGSVVRVRYSDGTTFYLNYNDFAVVADGQTIGANAYVKTNA